MIHNYISSFWRISILLTAVTAGILYGQAPQAALPNNDPGTVKTTPNPRQQSCSESEHLCSIPALFSTTKTRPAPSHALVVHTSERVCNNNASADATYVQALTTALSTTNSKVDSVRQVAANNGESYQAFDAQTNNLFSAYNSEVQQAYNTYINTLRGCRPSHAVPLLFQMFSP